MEGREGRIEIYPRDVLLLALVTGLAAGAYAALELAVAGAVGFPLDDAYIHLQMARNFSAGLGFSFNANQPVPASTAPLWTLCVALLYWLPGAIFSSVKIAGALLLFLCALLTLLLGLEIGLSRRAARSRCRGASPMSPRSTLTAPMSPE